MPLPETLLTAEWTDLDLRVVEGAWPEGAHGEMFISAPVVDPRLSFQLFGFGAMVRISMRPGSFGAPPTGSHSESARSTRRSNVCTSFNPTCSTAASSGSSPRSVTPTW